MNDLIQKIETLVDKATNASSSEDALRFSQAACNAANALNLVSCIESGSSGEPTER